MAGQGASGLLEQTGAFPEPLDRTDPRVKRAVAFFEIEQAAFDRRQLR